MYRRLLSIALSLLFVLTLCAPLLQMNFALVEGRRLHNLHKPKNPGLPTWGGIVRGKYQEQLAVWFLRRHGFWGHLVQADNQLNLELFNQISSKYKAALKVGTDKWLFQGLYLDHFNRVSMPTQQILEARALALKQLQDKLHARGIGFLFLISPNKIEVHPEIVPPQYHAPARHMRASTYERMLPILKQLGVEIFDTREFLATRSGGERRRYFTSAGSHWNDVGACEIVDEIARRIGEFHQRSVRRIRCEPLVEKSQPNATDLDLLIMANLWSGKRYKAAVPYPEASLIAENVELQPNVLMVGSSFGWSLMRFINRFRIQRNADFWYYYKRARNYPTKREYRIKPESLDWQKQLFERDYVIVEANISALDNAGFDFVADAVRALSEAPPT